MWNLAHKTGRSAVISTVPSQQEGLNPGCSHSPSVSGGFFPKVLTSDSKTSHGLDVVTYVKYRKNSTWLNKSCSLKAFD